MLVTCRIAPIEEMEKIKETLIYVKCFCKDVNRISELSEECFNNALSEIDIIIKELHQDFDE